MVLINHLGILVEIRDDYENAAPMEEVLQWKNGFAKSVRFPGFACSIACRQARKLADAGSTAARSCESRHRK